MKLNPVKQILYKVVINIADSLFSMTATDSRIEKSLHIHYKTDGEVIRPPVGMIFCFDSFKNAFQYRNDCLERLETEIWEVEAYGSTTNGKRISTGDMQFKDVANSWSKNPTVHRFSPLEGTVFCKSLRMQKKVNSL